MFSAAILDLDGLLIDSEPFWRRTGFEVLSRLGVPLPREGSDSTMGMRVDLVIAHWYQKHPWPDRSVASVLSEIVSKVAHFVRTEAKPQPGARELVDFFHGRGVPMAICSSSPSPVIEAAIERLNIGRFLRLYHSAENEPQGKPHPAVYFSTCRKLGVEPRDALAFEDSPNGVKAAKSAGIMCVYVPEAAVESGCVDEADMTLASLRDFNEQCYAQLLERTQQR